MAFSNSLLGIVHALAHPIGGLYDTAHGCVNAILLPEVIRYNLPAVEAKLPELAWGLGHRTDGDAKAAADIIQDAVDELLDATGAPRHLSSLGVARESLPDLAARALNDACILTSPRKAAAADLLSILEKSY